MKKQYKLQPGKLYKNTKKLFIMGVFVFITGLISGNSLFRIAEPVKQASDNEYKVVLKNNPQNKNKTDVYIKNLNTGTVKFFITLTEVYTGHYHNSEYHNSNLYIIRRIGSDGYNDKTWSSELWRYNSQKAGTKLYSGERIYNCKLQ